MRRDDIRILALNPFDDPEEFRIPVYSARSAKPEDVDALISELRNAVTRVESVTVLEIK
jgi:hypothetical protein